MKTYKSFITEMFGFKTRKRQDNVRSKHKSQEQKYQLKPLTPRQTGRSLDVIDSEWEISKDGNLVGFLAYYIEPDDDEPGATIYNAYYAFSRKRGKIDSQRYDYEDGARLPETDDLIDLLIRRAR